VSAHSLNAHRPQARCLPNKTDGSLQDSSAPIKPLAARLRLLSFWLLARKRRWKAIISSRVLADSTFH
jgi:hypothetical protein